MTLIKGQSLIPSILQNTSRDIICNITDDLEFSNSDRKRSMSYQVLLLLSNYYALFAAYPIYCVLLSQSFIFSNLHLQNISIKT